MKQAFLADKIFTGSDWLTDHVLLLEKGVITGILPEVSIPAGYEVRSFPGCLITPAFIDLQLYGGYG